MSTTYNNKLTVRTPPTEEPVSLDDVKNHLKVGYTDDDTLISTYISAVRERCELEVWRTFCTTAFTLSFDRFPSDNRNWTGTSVNSAIVGSSDYWQQVSTNVIKLPNPPCITVDEIRY